MKEGDLVMCRFPTDYGYSNTWWRVKFIDNDGTFIGHLERKHWCEYKDHEIGDAQRIGQSCVQHIYQEGEQFCYSDKISICTCTGLCRDK